MTQTMSDKLELIARCLRDGVEVQYIGERKIWNTAEVRQALENAGIEL